MATKTQVQVKEITASEALRKSWLAYLGFYGAAYERVKPLTAKAGETIDSLIAKGESIETSVQDAVRNMRERAANVYGDGFARMRRFLPAALTQKGRVEDLEAEVAALNKKVAALTKKPAAKRSAKPRAKAA